MEKLYHVVPLIWAVSDADNGLNSDIISMKDYKQADFFLMCGAVGQAAAVTMKKGADVTTCTTALTFTRYLKTGFELFYDAPSVDTPAAAAETILGGGSGAATIYKDTGSKLICYGFNGTTFVDNETVTCSGGKTVVADGIQKHEDILVPMVAASNTFNIEAVANRLYKIPISSDMLGDGYDTVCLNLGDANVVLVAAWAVLYGARYTAEIMKTALYD